jgi:hypothetical protein
MPKKVGLADKLCDNFIANVGLSFISHQVSSLIILNERKQDKKT